MSKPGDDWRTFYRWEKRQILEGRGSRDGPNLTQDLRAQWRQWRRRSDRNDYLRLIRWIEESESRLQRLDLNIEKFIQRGLGRHALHSARKSRVTLLGGLRTRLVSLQKITQRARDGSGKIIMSAASRINVARMLDRIDDEVRRTKLDSTLATAAEYFDNHEEAPKALQDYIMCSCEEITWNENDPYCTEQEMAARLQAEVREAQFYQDVDRVGWAKKPPASHAVRRSREEGDVECWGHPFDADRGEEMDGTREDLVREWEDFIASYRIVFGSATTPLTPLWAVYAAKSRAEMIFDHYGTSHYPPVVGTNPVDEANLAVDVFQTLNNLTNAENNFYIANPVYHEPIDTSVDKYLRKDGYRPEFTQDERPTRPITMPRPPVVFRQGETLEILSAGRRALRHVWETRIRVMMYQRRSARRVAEEMWCYYRALALFDSAQDQNEGRYWITDSGHELLRERGAAAKTRNSTTAELAAKRPALPGTVESSNLRLDWIMKGAVGDGTSGTVFLWVRYGRDGTIRGRMATKDCQFTARQWNKPKFWRPDEDGRPGRLSKEACIQALFSDLPRNESKIVELWDARTYRTHRVVRLYLEYCSLGTLVDLLARYSDNVDMETYNSRGVLPEFAVWALFESLVIAAYTMETGHLPGSQEPDSDWVVVHQDLRPPNIFMTNNTGDTWPSCPVFKVGDFGSAEQTNDTDPRNPQDLRRPGTADGAPPEQITEGTHDDGGIRLSSKGNIWSCGRNVLAAMGAGTLSDEDLAFVVKESPYSRTLYDLAQVCVQDDPEDRPGPEELLEEIRRHTEAMPPASAWYIQLDQWLKNLVRRLMDVPMPPGETSMKLRKPRTEEDRLIVKEDEYRLGMVDVTMAGIV